MLEKFIPTKYHNKAFRLKQMLNGFYTKSYSQEGEDMVLNRYFQGKNSGFYVDIGAHHPKRFSNTYFFYKKAWCGINIDAMPGSMDQFKKTRKRDTNIEAAISDKKSELTYYAFDEPAINGFDKGVSEERIKGGQKLLFKKTIETVLLSEILEKNIRQNQTIDFMSVDVEGNDLNVIRSNNWEKFRPEIVLIESLNKDVKNVLNEDINKFMCSINYGLIAKTINTCFYKNKG